MKSSTGFPFLLTVLPFALIAFACSESTTQDSQSTQPSAAGGAKNNQPSATGGTQTSGAQSSSQGDGSSKTDPNATGGAQNQASQTSSQAGGAKSSSNGSGVVTSAGGTGGQSLASSSGGTKAGASTATPANGDLLIDDFEDGDGTSLIKSPWYGYTDSTNGGNSTLTFKGAKGSEVVMNGDGFESSKSLEIDYGFDQGTYEYSPYVGFGTTLGTETAPYDLSPYAGLSYTYKGGAHTIRVETTEVTDYDSFGFVVAASGTWKAVTIPLKSFAQEGWGKKVTFDPSHALAVSFGLKGNTGDSATLQIDNLRAVKTLGNLAPDMTVKPAAPPKDEVIDSIEIANPLQAKAMQYLDKGYNITNWLEQDQFDGFRYDESYIEKLAKAGFKALRLPIDLDRFVATTSGSGDTLALTMTDELYTILDSFDAWTKKHGLSLTIDYHQYGTLINKNDPNSLATAVQAWSKVAEHFASNPREDIFFELLNEPELSFDTDPTKAEWTDLAEKMVAAIRAKDTVHTLIFGGTNWYGIDDLIARKPLSDKNVIYAFHDYDPFIFTHQGATWANMASTHDLPFPYDANRWSAYYSDLGFNTSMESWILNAAKNYYRDGNKATIRNTIVGAKRWAIANDVAIICNEFGAYDKSSQLADRAQYYTDLISVFNELAIPWQIWFMIMDTDTGAVIPEYRKAFRLE